MTLRCTESPAKTAVLNLQSTETGSGSFAAMTATFKADFIEGGLHLKKTRKSRAPDPRCIRDRRSILSNILPPDDVAHMALSICELLGIHVDTSDLSRRFRNRKLLPVVYENNEYSIWIDRYYIAIEWNQDGKIHYAYLTRKHVYEEWHADLVSRNEGRNIALDSSIRKQFATAWAKMIKCEKGYAYRELRPAEKASPPFNFSRWK